MSLAGGISIIENYINIIDVNIQLNYKLFYEICIINNINNRYLTIITLAVINLIFNLFHCLLFYYCDKFNLLNKYAIRDDKHKLPSNKLYKTALNEAYLDTFLIKPFMMFILYPYVIEPYVSFDYNNIPSIIKICYTIIIMMLSFSTTLYFLHMAFHKFSFLYKYHKKHHEFHESVGIAGLYSHFVEGIFTMMHVLIPIIVLKPHFITTSLFFIVTLIEIVDAHCGYDVPWKFLYLWSDFYPWGCGARAHDFHHSHNIGMYGGGLTGLWDYIFGSDKEFRKYIQTNINNKTKLL